MQRGLFLMEVLWALVSICHQAGSESHRPRECEDGINCSGMKFTGGGAGQGRLCTQNTVTASPAVDSEKGPLQAVSGDSHLILTWDAPASLHCTWFWGP